MDDKYILDGHMPVPVDLMTWALWFQDGEKNRRVAYTEIRPGIIVSTVFLGIDMNFWAKGPPLLFETMVRSDYGWDDEVRYSTWDEAVAGHLATVAKLEGQLSAATSGQSSDPA
jgi:hypothetical protein